ncbi:MAG TPA: hypothetical protein VII29_13205 [Terriglobales bacterium]
MAATGELIRLINYVDDINTTLRRITAAIPAMDAEERKRLAENLRACGVHFATLMEKLDQGT